MDRRLCQGMLKCVQSKPILVNNAGKFNKRQVNCTQSGFQMLTIEGIYVPSSKGQEHTEVH